MKPIQKKSKKHRKFKKYMIILGVCLIAGSAGTVYVLTVRKTPAVQAMQMVQTAAVETGNISNTIVGTGTLEAALADSVQIPSGLVVDEVYVEAGDTVKLGDILAVINKSSLLSAIEDTQKEITDLDEEMNDLLNEEDADTVTTNISGRIKKLYLSAGDDVSKVMLKKGALLLLSLDGKMAVSLELASGSGAEEGDSVTVTLSDGAEKTGTIENISGSGCVVTLTDNGPEFGEKVTVTDGDGKELGSGKLTIHQQLAVTGTGGTVDTVEVSENDAVEAGDTLLELEDAPSSAKYQTMLADREEKTLLLQRLLSYEEDNTVKAGFDGMIQEVNVTAAKSSGSGTSGSGTSGSGATGSGISGSGATGGIVPASAVRTMSSKNSGSGAAEFMFAAASASAITDQSDGAPESKEEESGTPDVTEAASGQEIGACALSVAAPASGASPQSIIQETNGYTGSITWMPADAPFLPSVTYSANITLTAKEGFYFPANTALSLEGCVLSGIAVSADQKQLSFTAVFPMTAKTEPQREPQTEPQTGTEKDSESETKPEPDSQKNTDNKQPQTEPQTKASDKTGDDKKQTIGSEKTTDTNALDKSSGNVTGSQGGYTGGQASGGGTSVGGGTVLTGTSGSTATGSSTQSGSAADTSETSTSMVTVFTMSPEDSALLTVNVDELDILSVNTDQEAVVTFDAIENQTFKGNVTKISNSASASGGVTKYPVQITIPKEDSMMIGMNASATITIENKENILLIPMNALQEQGNKVFVYTQKDDDGNLSGETEITTGLSDGKNVEVVSGLSEGDTVYYSKTGAATESTGFGYGEMPSGRGMFEGGEMPSGGGMPSGSGMGMPEGMRSNNRQ